MPVIFGLFLYAMGTLVLNCTFARGGEWGWWWFNRGRSEFGSDVVAVLPKTGDQFIILWRRIRPPPRSFDIGLEMNKDSVKLDRIRKRAVDLPCVCLRSTSRLEDLDYRPPQRSSHNIATKSHTRIRPPHHAPSSHPSQHVQLSYFRRHAQRYNSDRHSRFRHTPCGIARNEALEVDANPQRNPRQPRVSHETSDVPKWTMSTGWSPTGVWRGCIGGGFWRVRKRLGGRVFGIVALDWIGILNRNVRLVEIENSVVVTLDGRSCL